MVSFLIWWRGLEIVEINSNLNKQALSILTRDEPDIRPFCLDIRFTVGYLEKGRICGIRPDIKFSLGVCRISAQIEIRSTPNNTYS